MNKNFCKQFVFKITFDVTESFWTYRLFLNGNYAKCLCKEIIIHFLKEVITFKSPLKSANWILFVRCVRKYILTLLCFHEKTVDYWFISKNFVEVIFQKKHFLHLKLILRKNFQAFTKNVCRSLLAEIPRHYMYNKWFHEKSNFYNSSSISRIFFLFSGNIQLYQEN